MKRTLFLFLLFLQLATIASSQSSFYREPVVKADSVLKNLMSFLIYRQNHLRLYEDFIAVDSSFQVISKKTFFKKLTTGRYLPLRLQSTDTSYYQLYPITYRDNDIESTLAQWGDHLYSFYKMEGTVLPKFNFTDLKGKSYTKLNTKGKIVVLKCWFVNCVPCVKEMPSLNKLVDSYTGNEDIVFLGLAMDNAAALKAFLKTKAFHYAVVANKKNYMIDDLGVTGFPTHIILGRNGLVAKVVDTDKELAIALANEFTK